MKKKGEIPWIRSEAFEPHYFSFLDNSEEAEIEEQKTQDSENPDSLPFGYEFTDPL